jgi:hypothetical protein
MTGKLSGRGAAQVEDMSADVINMVSSRWSGGGRWWRGAHRATGSGALIVAVAIALGGCTATSGSGSVPLTIPHRLAVHHGARAVAKARLRRIVLTRHDVPRSWLSTPHQDSSSSGFDGTQEARILRCMGLHKIAFHGVASVHSADFRRGATRFFSRATRYASERDVRYDVRALRSHKFGICFQRLFRSYLRQITPAGVSIRSANVGFQRPTGHAPRNLVGTMVLRVTAVGTQRVTAGMSIAVITGPRLEVELETASVNSRMPARLRDRLIAVLARRAARA